MLQAADCACRAPLPHARARSRAHTHAHAHTPNAQDCKLMGKALTTTDIDLIFTKVHVGIV